MPAVSIVMVRRLRGLSRGAALLCLVAVSCDSGKPAAPAGAKPGSGAPSSTAPASAARPDAAAPNSPPPRDWHGQAVIEGVVRLATPLPPARPLTISGDQFCVRSQTGGPVLPPGREIGEGGTLPHVFVYIKRGIDGTYTPPTEPVVLNQKSCMYEPYVFGLMVGQPLDILNSDATVHNVNAQPRRNEAFNFAQARQGAVSRRTFARPEVMVRFKCDVHGWMEAFAGVQSHPFFAVTGPNGAFRIGRLPPGTYTLEAWHPLLGTLSQDVTVDEAQPARVAFVYQKKP